MLVKVSALEHVVSAGSDFVREMRGKSLRDCCLVAIVCDGDTFMAYTSPTHTHTHTYTHIHTHTHTHIHTHTHTHTES